MYKEYSPCSILAPFIYHFWEYKGETRSGLKFNIPPHGCSDFVFIVGNAADCIRNSLIMKPYHSYFFGPMNTFTELVAHTIHSYYRGTFSPMRTFSIYRYSAKRIDKSRN